MPGPPQIGNINMMATLLGSGPLQVAQTPPRSIQNPRNEYLRDRKRRSAQQRIKDAADVAGNQVWEMGPDGVPRLKVQQDRDRSYFPDKIDVDELPDIRSATEMADERLGILEALKEFEGPMDPNNPLSGSRSPTLERFGVTGDMDFDTASQAIWDYVGSDKDMTREDLAGLREWLIHKRRAGGSEESPWWRIDPYQDEMMDPKLVRSGLLGEYTRARPPTSRDHIWTVGGGGEKGQITRQTLLQNILGGWNEDVGLFGSPIDIGGKRGYEWGPEPEDIREKQRTLGGFHRRLENMRSAMEYYPEDFSGPRKGLSGGGHTPGPAELRAREEFEQERRNRMADPFGHSADSPWWQTYGG